MLARHYHRGVESDDGEVARHVEDPLLDRLSGVFPQEIDLGGIAPGKSRPVVAVVDVGHAAGGTVEALEDDRGVGTVVVVVLEPDAYAAVPREVAAVELVAGEGTLLGLHEELGPLAHPGRVDAGVVGHHVRREPDASPTAPLAQALEGGPAAELGRDLVVEERIRARGRLGVAAAPLYLGARRAALPEADEPKAVESARGQGVELLVRYGVQRADVPAVAPRELVEPDEARFGHHHDIGHPVLVRAEALVLPLHPRVDVGPRRSRPGKAGPLLLADQVEGAEEAEQALAEHESPAAPDVVELAGQRVRRRDGGTTEHGAEVLVVGPEFRHGGHARAENADRLGVGLG